MRLPVLITLVMILYTFASGAVPSSQTPPSAGINLPVVEWKNPTLLAAGVGAAATVLVLLIGQVGAIITQHLSQKHQAHLQKNQILASFREKIYLEALEQLAVSANSISKIINGDPAKDFEPIQSSKLAEALNKVSIIAAEKTVKALVDYQRHYTKAITELAIFAFKRHHSARKYALLETEVNELLDVQKDLVERMEDNNFDLPARARAHSQFLSLKSRFQTLFDDQKKALILSDDQRKILTIEVLKRLKILSLCLADVINEIRIEIGTASNGSGYKEYVSVIYDELLQNLEVFESNINTEILKQ